MNFFEKAFNFKTYKTRYNEIVAQNKETLKMYENLHKAKNTLESHYEDSSRHIDVLNKNISEKDEKIKSLHETRVTLNKTVTDLSEEKSVLEKELKSLIAENHELLQRTEFLFEDMMNSLSEDISLASRYFDNIIHGINKILGLFNGIEIVSKHGAYTKNAAEASRDKVIGIGIKLSQYKIYFENKMLYKAGKDSEIAAPGFFEKP